MPAFRYLAMSPKGERISGELKAEALEGAIRELQGTGHVIISLAPKEAASEVGLSQRLAASVHALRTRVPLKDMVFFTRQLATMFSAGMTVERAVNGLAANEANLRLRKILTAVGADLQKGRSLSESVAKHPGAFDRLYISLIKAGEAGGALGTALDRLADYQERSEEVRRKVISALYYPAFVMIFLFVSTCVLVLKIAPMFDKVYRSFGADLPAPTKALMAGSRFLLDNLALGAFLFPAAGAGVFLFSLSDRGRALFDAGKLKLPVLGALIRDSLMATYARTFGLLLQSGVPVVDSLTLVAQTVGNTLVAQGVHSVRDLIKDGSSIHGAMRRALVFPSLMVQLVATGEETGEVEKLLLKAAEYYEKKVDALIGRLTSVLEPMLIVLMGVVVGALVIVIYLPIFYLGMAMKRGMK
ncbi:MAG TPA: type II secretion system F family protein [Fibrobacteria bacterium]|nr:type II secretion system F family protein [Fibrobacteria bacterium]